MNRPDFFIVGAPKCGTTAPFSYLEQHPQVHMSRVKEPHYFSGDITQGNRRRIAMLEDYLALFAGAYQPRNGRRGVDVLPVLAEGAASDP